MTITSYDVFVNIFEALEVESAPLTDHYTRVKIEDALPRCVEDLLYGKPMTQGRQLEIGRFQKRLDLTSRGVVKLIPAPATWADDDDTVSTSATDVKRDSCMVQ